MITTTGRMTVSTSASQRGWPLSSLSSLAAAASAAAWADAAGRTGARMASGVGLSMLATHDFRSEEHTSELQSLMRISYAVFCLKTKTKHTQNSEQQHNTIT